MSNFYEKLEAHWLSAVKQLSLKQFVTQKEEPREFAMGCARLAKEWQKKGQISQLHLIRQENRYGIIFCWAGAFIVLDDTGLYTKNEWVSNDEGLTTHTKLSDLEFTERSLRYAFALEDILDSQGWSSPIDYVISNTPTVSPNHLTTLPNTRSRTEAMSKLASRANKNPELYLHCITDGKTIATWRYHSVGKCFNSEFSRQVA